MNDQSTLQTSENILRFRRQFLVTSKQLDPAGLHLRQYSFGKVYLFAHPDLSLTLLDEMVHGTKFALLGFILDPLRPRASDLDILTFIANSCRTNEELGRSLYGLTGRFVLLVQRPDGLYVFHDPCGLRTVYYIHADGHLSIGSSPSILALATNIEAGDRVRTYMSSAYVRTKKEHWLPCGISLYEDVQQLVPNHYLRANDASQIRFWPSEVLRLRDKSDVAVQVGTLLSGSLAGAALRFRLSFPLTAGLDSRMLLSASRELAPSIFFYTLKYRALDDKSPDIWIPRTLLSRLGLRHHVIDCTLDASAEFAEIYRENTLPSHMNDWGKIAYGMLQGLPERRVAVKGNCAEITRCYLYPTGQHEAPSGPDDIIRHFKGWEALGFIRSAVAAWIDETKDVAERLGVNILDLFHWEVRQGGWQAQSQLEWDIAQEVFTPFNNRQILELMLSVPACDRIGPKHELQHEIMELLWPQVRAEPVNPRLTPRPKSFVNRVRSALHRFVGP